MFPYSTGNLNAIAGDYGLFGSTVIGYSYALALNDTINDDLHFLDFNLLVNSNNQYAFPAMASVSNGHSNGNWKGGKTDHFLGLKFSPDSVNTYFGWAR